MKELAHWTGRGEAIIKCTAAAAHGLPSSTTPLKKLGSEGKRKITKETDVLLQRGVMNSPSITAVDLKKNHPQLLKRVNYNNSRLPPEETPSSKLSCCKETLFSLLTWQEWWLISPKNIGIGLLRIGRRSCFLMKGTCFRRTPESVHHPSNTSRFPQSYTVRTVKHSDQVMVWSCFSGNGGRMGFHFFQK